MKDMDMMKRTPLETEEEYLIRLAASRKTFGLTWDDVAQLMNAATGQAFGESAYRKKVARIQAKPATSTIPAVPTAQQEEENSFYEEFEPVAPAPVQSKDPTLEERILMMQKLKVQNRDNLTQINALIRRMAREDSLKEIARDAVNAIQTRNLVLPRTHHAAITGYDAKTREALLCISDWHYGIEINNYFNTYNPEVARMRIRKLLDETIEAIQLHKVSRLHVLNLGDMIAGRIHLQLRVNTRIDVITQTIEVSELIAEFLAELNQYVKVEYYDTLDNHSRLEPNLKESLELETLCRITTWYLKQRMEDTGVTIHDNKYGEDIINLNVLGHEIAGVHGHNDKPERVVQNMQTRTRKTFDLIVAAHYHHFKADESSETAIIYNGSMMGTDEYAEKLRVASIPSQNLFIMSVDNPTKAIYKINLN